MTRRENRYTVRVTGSEDDGEYVGLCAEFPGLSWLAAAQESALRGIRRGVARAVGHRRLAIHAAEAGVSLNRLASARLSR